MIYINSFSLQIIGDGSVAQYVLSGQSSGALGINFLSVNVAWGVAVAMGVYVSAGVSGRSFVLFSIFLICEYVRKITIILTGNINFL